MPLYESKETRTKRLISSMTERLLANLFDVVTGESDQTTHSAWLMGGSAVALAGAQHLSSLENAWRRGDEPKASGLIKVFTLHMISQWYRGLDRREGSANVSESVRTMARKIAASNILEVFGERSEREVNDFLNLDAQFRYEWDWAHREGAKTGGVLVYGHCLLLSKALIYCGRPGYIDWENREFPVKTAAELLTQPGFPH